MQNNWATFKRYINSKQIGDKIFRKTFKSEVDGYLTFGSFYKYCKHLHTLHMLEKHDDPGCWVIKQHIPDKMNTVVLFELLSKYQRWQHWFIPIEERVDSICKTICSDRVTEKSKNLYL